MITLGTINLLVGIITAFFALGIALGALAYAVEGSRGQGIRRRWNLLVAFLLGAFAWSTFTTIEQDFARASDPKLAGMPADAPSLFSLAFWTLASIIILVAGASYLRSLLRMPASRAK